MERRDYLEKEIEKMQAVLQRIFRMRVDKEDVEEVISTELMHYFNTDLCHIRQMTEEEFQIFAKNKNNSLLNYLGSLLYASVDPEIPLSDTNRSSLRKALRAWKIWESKTKTLDLEQLEIQNKIVVLLNEQAL